MKPRDKFEMPDVNKEKSTQHIGQDLWRQLKRVPILMFKGNKRNHKN